MFNKLLIMKKLLLLLFSIPTLVLGQNDQKITNNDEFDLINNQNATNYEYINLERDLTSASNLSLGFIGSRFTPTLNLMYNLSNVYGDVTHRLGATLNPMWGYYGISCTYGKNDWNLRTGVSSDFGNSFSILETVTKSYDTKLGKITFGVNGIYRRFVGYYDYEYEEYVPADIEMDVSPLLGWSKEYKIGDRLTLTPQLFFISSLIYYDDYWTGEYDENGDYVFDQLTYTPGLNLDTYYGASADVKITKRFILNINFRANYSYSKWDREDGWRKLQPFMLSTGTNFQF